MVKQSPNEVGLQVDVGHRPHLTFSSNAHVDSMLAPLLEISSER